MKQISHRIPVMIVGAGRVANNDHVPAWKGIKDVEIVAVCDKNQGNLQDTAARWGIPRLYGTIDELLEEEEEGIVDICTTPETHVDIAVRAMEKGHHVVVEKPVAVSSADTDTILREYQRRRNERIELCVVQSFLFAPEMLTLRSILNKKPMDVLAVAIEMLHTPNDAMLSDRNHWVHSMRAGRLGENVIHPVYLLRSFLGPLSLMDVHCTKKGSYDWVPCDELHVACESDGKFGSIYVSFNNPRWTLNASVRIYGKQRILNLDGTNLTIQSQGPALQGYLPEVRWSKWDIIRDSFVTSAQILGSTAHYALGLLHGRLPAHQTMFRYFVGSIRNGRQTLPYTVEEACEANKTYVELTERIERVSHRL